MNPEQARPVQYLTDEYLDRCRSMSPKEILQFLEGFRLLTGGSRPSSRLISLKVPQDLLDAFRRRCELEGTPYQAQIKRLMREWLGPVGPVRPARPL